MARGMILAAGRGTRLGPLTATLPKPLLPVANQPVMLQGIASLRRLGVTDICVNICYRAPRMLEVFGDGRDQQVALRWLVEREASGTAGGLRGMQQYLAGDEIVVIAGDAMLDVDLRPLQEAHRARRAFATLATVMVHDPSLYGVVVADADGRIRHFQEKPPAGTEISRQANTGIYIFDPRIFDLIPATGYVDFALHVFPEILRRALPFYAIPVEGYWTDIGNPGDYLRANLDYLAGRLHIAGDGRRAGNNLVAADAVTDGAALSGCLVGARARLAPGCALTDCVVWPDTTVTAGCRLTSAVCTPTGIFIIDGKTARPLEPVASGI